MLTLAKKYIGLDVSATAVAYFSKRQKMQMFNGVLLDYVTRSGPAQQDFDWGGLNVSKPFFFWSGGGGG